jgi:hypothetical protein
LFIHWWIHSWAVVNCEYHSVGVHAGVSCVLTWIIQVSAYRCESWSHCLLIVMFGFFTFNVIVDIIGLLPKT